MKLSIQPQPTKTAQIALQLEKRGYCVTSRSIGDRLLPLVIVKSTQFTYKGVYKNDRSKRTSIHR